MLEQVEVPMSESVDKQQLHWSENDCIIELQRIANIDTDKVISRNYFRVNSRCSESTWNRYFGTFEEFKRQAGITLSRHAAALEKSIAKHASKDKARIITDEKRSYEGKYAKDLTKRFQTALICSDVHDTSCDPFYRRLFVETAERVQPEKIVLNGDIFDLPEFSSYTKDPRTFDVINRIKWVHTFLEDLRNASPDSEMIFVEGNHEYRLLRHLSEETPALMAVLSDLHGFTIPKLLGLDKYEVNFIARADMSAFSESDVKKQLDCNYVILWDSLLCHHFPHGFNMGYPGINGHHHSHIVRNGFSPRFGPFEWHQLGSGHIRQASYTAGEKWSNGFMIAHVDTHKKRTQFEYIDCTHDACMIGGKFYPRQESEIIPW